MFKIKYHILFWLFIAAYNFDYLIDIYSLKESILFTLFELGLYLGEFYVTLYFLLPKYFERSKKMLYFFLTGTLLSVFCSLYFLFGLNETLLSDQKFRGIFTFFLNHTLFIIISYLVWYFNKYHAEKQKRLQLENERLQTEISLLKSKLSPHFLFNSLNDIYALAILKKDGAAEMISALSDLLRYFIYECEKEWVPLNAEIQAIENYIEIQKIREVAGKNNIEFQITGDTSSLTIPPMIFLTLIENIFKHGNLITHENGFAKIYLQVQETKIELEMQNSFEQKIKHAGIGIQNIQSQLELLFKDQYLFEIHEEDQIYTTRLIIYGRKK